MPKNLFDLFPIFFALVGWASCRQGLTLVWHSILWVLWDQPNGCIFVVRVPDIATIVDTIIAVLEVVSHGGKYNTRLFYEWFVDPNDCMNRSLVFGLFYHV